MSLNAMITYSNEETAGGGWSIVTVVQKKKYRMIRCAARMLSMSTSGHVLCSRFAKGVWSHFIC